MRDATAVLYVVDDIQPSVFESTVRTLRRIPDSQNTFVIVSNMQQHIGSVGLPLTSDIWSPSSFFTPIKKHFSPSNQPKETSKNALRRSVDNSSCGPGAARSAESSVRISRISRDLMDESLDVSLAASVDPTPERVDPVLQATFPIDDNERLECPDDGSRLNFGNMLDILSPPSHCETTESSRPRGASESKHKRRFDWSLASKAVATPSKSSVQSPTAHAPSQLPRHEVNTAVRQFYYKVVRRVFPDWESKAIRCPRFHFIDTYDEREMVLGRSCNNERILHLRECVAGVIETALSERLKLDGDFLICGIQNCKDYFLTQSEIIEFGASISAQSQVFSPGADKISVPSSLAGRTCGRAKAAAQSGPEVHSNNNRKNC